MPDSSRSPVRSLHILVAEDSAVYQTLTSQMLEKEGHLVRVVSNGKEAARAVETEVFDLVLMDVEMPEMDGLAATRQIRNAECQHGGHVPIIAFTSLANASKCRAAGADEHLIKPSTPAGLRRAIHQVQHEARSAPP